MAKRVKNMIKADQKPLAEGIRLNKYLSDAGICSRRQADTLIEEGKVTIEGQLAEKGTKIYEGQMVLVNGKPVKPVDQLVLLAFHKPRGIVCTAEKREPNNIIDYLHYPSRIYPIGRLDKDSEGIILLTNHGELANRISKARYYHEKEYVVTVDKPITPDFLSQMGMGVSILDTITRPCKIVQEGKRSFRIILTQGLNRQIRRMCETLGYRVQTLKRVRIMNVSLGQLKQGQYRNVTKEEIRVLNQMLQEETEHGNKVKKNT